MSIPSSDLKNLILNLQAPCKIEKINIPWKCFDRSIEEWCQIVDANIKDGVQFEKASQKHFQSPQWECFRSKTDRMKMMDFMNFAKSTETEDHWLSYSYKYLRDFPGSLKDEIDFEFFGFPEIRDDITFWLGSRGAHTPCHYDTYGCNVVVQIYGKKMWFLFPPDSLLNATRIPYEESSVYCKENFYSPSDKIQFQDIQDEAHIAILHPGDVLLIPPRWWHYVENLETSLAMNAWIPLKSDIEFQINECLTKCVIGQLSFGLEELIKNKIINPNELLNFNESRSTLEELLPTLDYLINKMKSINDRTEPVLQKSKHCLYDHCYLPLGEIENLFLKYKNLSYVRKASKEEFLQLIENNMKRFDPCLETEPNWVTVSNLTKRISSLIDAFCKKDVLLLVKKHYVESELLH